MVSPGAPFSSSSRRSFRRLFFDPFPDTPGGAFSPDFPPTRRPGDLFPLTTFFGDLCFPFFVPLSCNRLDPPAHLIPFLESLFPYLTARCFLRGFPLSFRAIGLNRFSPPSPPPSRDGSLFSFPFSFPTEGLASRQQRPLAPPLPYFCFCSLLA